jgi:hypothetical protein
MKWSAIQAIAGLGQPPRVKAIRIQKIHLRLRAGTEVETDTASLFQSNVKSRWSPDGCRDRTSLRRRVHLVFIGVIPWDWGADGVGYVCVTERSLLRGSNVLPIPDA